VNLHSLYFIFVFVPSSFFLVACRVASDDPVSGSYRVFPYPFTVLCNYGLLCSSLLTADGMGARVLVVNS